MIAASNSEAITSAMRALPSRIRSEANISDRPGQLGRLELIATEVEALLVAATRTESAALATDIPNRGDDTSETANGPQNATRRPAPVDSGAIGRLNEAEIVTACPCGHEVMWHHERRGCGYHGYSDRDRCRCWLTSEQCVAAIVREHTDRALAEVEQRIQGIDYSPELEHGDNGDWMRDEVLAIVRAARQEQGR